MNFANRRSELADSPEVDLFAFEGNCEYNGAQARNHRGSAAIRTLILTALAILFAAVVPSVLATHQIFIGSSDPGEEVIWNTECAALAAMVLGYPIIRRLFSFPRITSVVYVLSTFSVTFFCVAMAIKALAGARITLLATQFVLSFLIVTALTSLFLVIGRQRRVLNFAVVPGGSMRLNESSRLKITHLKRPPRAFDGFTAIVADLRIDLAPEWERFVAFAALNSVPVYHVKQLTEALTGRVAIDHLSENTFGAIIPAQIYPLIKRVIDVAGCVILLPFVAPLLIISAVLIKLDTPGPIFFWQKRIGFRGQVFTACKLRTMTHNAQQDGPLFTVENDARITGLGRWLRKYRIDEWPQVINILRGEMSWIGPRPEAVELGQWYEKEVPFYLYRHIVRPGITGWAQVHQGNVAAVSAAKEKLEYDFFYIKNLSIWLDAVILIKTLKTILSGFGAR